MGRLQLDRHSSSLSRALSPLVNSKHIGLIDAKSYGLGNVYYLKKKAALIISSELGISLNTIDYLTSSPKLSSQSIYHRTRAISCQIELFLSAQESTFSIPRYDRDIDSLADLKRNHNLIRKTRVTISPYLYIEPDAIFFLDSPNGRKLYCLEYEHRDFTKKTLLKANLHLQALNKKSVSQKYGHEKAHRTLFIFSNSSTKNAVMKSIYKQIPSIGSWFLFKSYEDIIPQIKVNSSTFQISEKKNFLAAWQQASTDEVRMW